jgi:hypothetical protein
MPNGRRWGDRVAAYVSTCESAHTGSRGNDRTPFWPISDSLDYNGHIEIHSSLLNVVLHDEPHINS